MSAAMGARPRAEVGVCIVLVERQPDQLFITVRTNRNLDRHLYSAHPEAVQHFTDADEAINAAAEFLRSFAET